MNRRLLLAWSLILSGCGSPRTGEAPHEDEHDEHGEEAPSDRVQLDPHVVESNGIRTELAARRVLLGSLEVPAEIQVNPDQTAHVSPLLPGRILETKAALGQRVEHGDVLATLESAELAHDRGALRAAQARQKAADAGLERAESLVGEGISAAKTRVEARAKAEQAEAEVVAIRSALAVYGKTRGSGVTLALTSSIDGTIVERHASPGEYVDQRSDPFVVANLDSVWVMGRVYEQEIGQVSLGMRAQATFIAYPGKAWTGTVDYISPTLDARTRTIAVRMVLENPEGELRPGMFGTLALEGESALAKDGTVLAVPRSALVSLDDRSVVFVQADPTGDFVVRDVVPGAAAHGFVEIREGLSTGEVVVTRGAFVLKSVLLQSSIGEGHAH